MKFTKTISKIQAVLKLFKMQRLSLEGEIIVLFIFNNQLHFWG